MGDRGNDKKDLTSLVELSQSSTSAVPEVANESVSGELDISADSPPPDPMAQDEFLSLEEFSKQQGEVIPPLTVDQPIHLNADVPEPEMGLSLDPVEPAAAEPAAGEPGTAVPALGDTSDELVNAPPAGIPQAAHFGSAPAEKQDLTKVKKFGEKLAIGRPKVEAVPAFSLLVSNPSGAFSDKAITAIQEILTVEDFGIRMEDVAVQLSQGKLLIPQISEFAAIALAQKLRDAVENIELDLAEAIFKSSQAGDSDESFLYDQDHYDQHVEEIRDLGAEPKAENDVFSTTLSEVSDYQITRVLSVINASQVLSAAVAEDPSKRDFEIATEKLTRDLVNRAFKLRANGVIGISFNLRPMDGKTYRLMGTGTAVRARRRNP